MATLRLRIESPSVVTRTLRFDKLPVRIGRAPECDYCLAYSFVSRRHVQIDVRDGQLCIRDEGSRTGTRAADGQSLEPRQWVLLASIGHAFLIGPMHFLAELLEGNPEDPDSEADDTVVEGSDDSATRHYEAADVDAAELCSTAREGAIVEAIARYRDAADALAALLAQAAMLPADRLRKLASSLAMRQPNWDAPSPLRAFIEGTGLRPASGRIEATALRALGELSRYHVPYAPPVASVDAVTAFTARLDRALAVLTEGTVTVEAALSPESVVGTRERSRPSDLAAHLLDWTGDHSAIEQLEARYASMVQRAAEVRAGGGARTSLRRALAAIARRVGIRRAGRLEPPLLAAGTVHGGSM